MRIQELFFSERDLPRVDLVGIIAHALSVSRERILMDPERVLDRVEQGTIRQLIDERRKGKPLAYLTHLREFFSEPFYVDERVLIPRPETELLVEEAVRIMRSGEGVSVLDMGTGSGIIGILLARDGAESVLCIDVSQAALVVARKNARAFGLEGRIAFVASDLFSAVREGRTFDLICANLPYVAAHEWEKLCIDVKGFEPKTALVGGDAGTELYERYLEEIGAYLTPNGTLLCEVGGGDQAGPLCGLLKKAGFETAVLNDFAGHQRVIKAFVSGDDPQTGSRRALPPEGRRAPSYKGICERGRPADG